MIKLSPKHAEQLKKNKDRVRIGHDYFLPNFERFNMFMNFTFVSTISEGERALLKQINKACIEFNIVEAPVNKLCGQFAKELPSVEVTPTNGKSMTDKPSDEEQKLQIKTAEAIEGHFRYVIDRENKKGLQYQSYRNCLGGGYGAMQVFTAYENEMSFHQEMRIENVYDPTLIGIDPNAKRADKRDGEYMFQLFPMQKDEFLAQYKNKLSLSVNTLKWSRDFDQFNWSYKNNRSQEIMLVCEFFERKMIRKKIVFLSNGKSMTRQKYDAMVEEWLMSGRLEQIPVVVKERMTKITKIIRYVMIENQILEMEELPIKLFPIVFIDGNSILSRGLNNQAIQQRTKPFCELASGAQKLKNVAGQTAADHLDSMYRSQIVVDIEAVPEGQMQAYTQPQLATSFIHQTYRKDGKPLPEPHMMVKPPLAPEVLQTFSMADQVATATLGMFDGSVSNMADNQLSGIAMETVLTAGNDAAMPYVINQMLGWQSVADVFLEMLPFYVKTPMSLPIIDREGKEGFILINQDDGISLSYNPEDFQIKVEAGPSFNIQQSKALNQILSLAKAMPQFGQFINDVGLPIILDNVDVRGIDKLKDMADDWMKKQADMQKMMQEQAMNEPKMEQMAMQMAQQKQQLEMQKMQIDAQIEQQKLVQAAEKNKTESLIKLGHIENEKDKVRVDLIKVMIDAEEGKEKAHSDKVSKAVDMSLRTAQHELDKSDRQFQRTASEIEQTVT